MTNSINLVFESGGERYALDASAVVEVIPRVTLRPVPLAPSWIAGLLRYHGTAVPVVDLGALLTGQTCRPYLSTRIVVVRHRPSAPVERLLGLQAESMLQTLEVAEEEFVHDGIRLAEAPFLGQLAVAGGADIWRVRLDRLLPAELERMLYSEDLSRPEVAADAPDRPDR
jgi:chemotaxis-related protein WspB